MRALKDLLVLAVVFTVLGLAVSCRAGDDGQGRLDWRAAVLLKYQQLAKIELFREGDPPDESRRISRDKSRMLKSRPVRLPAVADREVPGPAGAIPVRIYTPGRGKVYPVMVYYHGGGWFMGSIETHDVICRKLTVKTPAVVVSVDYRLAPEHPFPAAVDDAYAALSWVSGNASSFGGDARRLAVAGDSAGANLAAVVSILARDRKGPAIAGQFLAYPATDSSRLDTRSMRDFGEGYYLTRRYIEIFRSLYAPNPQDWENPLVSPLLAPSLAGGASIVRGDVTRAETLSGAMAGVDAVVHVAGSVGFQPWRECIAINREGARNVAGEAVRAGVRRFIHLSSVAVYGRIPEVPIREDSPLKKIGDPYGDTKIDAENILQEQARQGKLDLTIIRPTVVYGPGDNKFLPSLLGNLRREGFRIIGDGTQSVDLVHVDDVAACVLRVLQEPRTIRKAYNLTNPENPSWNEMIRMVCSEAGLPMPRGHLPFRTAFLLAGVMELLSRLSGKPPRLNRYTLRVVGRPYRYLTDAAQRDLGFAPSIGLLDGLRQCLKATRKRDDTAEAPLLVIGAGAIGGVLGGLLARAGRRVAFLVRGEEAARRIRADGLKVSGVRGAFTVRVEASHRPGDLAGPFGLVLVAVKAYDLAAALRPALGLVAPAGLVVSLQNGTAIEDLEALAGADRAVGCMVGWGATLHPDGTAELTSEGSLVIGSRSPRAQARLEPLRAALGAAFPTAVSADILADLYSKLIVNSCITSLGALSGRNLGWMLARRRYRVAFIGIIREAMAVADALGIRVPAYAGRLDYYAFLRGQGPLDGWRRHLFIRLMGLKYRRLKSSSLQSLERKRPTEVDWFNGWISRKGRERGVPTPLNDRLTAMIHEIESGARPISPRNLEGSLPGLL